MHLLDVHHCGAGLCDKEPKVVLSEEVVMGFIGGDLRESFIGRIKGANPRRLLAVPIDVGKSSGALVCDFWGEIIVSMFAFDLNERGFQDFAVVLARAEAERNAGWIHVGLEQASHNHRPLQARLEAHGLEVTLFNPAKSKPTATRICCGR